ncbi:tRNA pseudouridine(38-40) synthase TruA [candidate division WOR-3 bacterium]|nr:tRNA pseudouridine(38-40) synthase TruA [candidate division WOR-3 bacterium]
MQNIKIIVEYDGTDFSGWQVQPGKRTVQGELEKALRIIFNKKIRVTGSGRTDTGVHALGQVVSFAAPKQIPPEEFKNAINGNIPYDIFVKDCKRVHEDFNARFSASSRIYRYQIAKGKSVFNRRYFFQIEGELNINDMKKAKKELIGEKDFSYLATKDRGICYVKRIKISEDKNNIFIEVEANRFLRRMVRGIVGLLLSVGKGDLKPSDTKKVLSGMKRRPPVAPPQGLFLIKVKY